CPLSVLPDGTCSCSISKDPTSSTFEQTFRPTWPPTSPQVNRASMWARSFCNRSLSLRVIPKSAILKTLSQTLVENTGLIDKVKDKLSGGSGFCDKQFIQNCSRTACASPAL